MSAAVQQGDVNPRGLYDLDRRPRRVGLAYRQLIEAWREVRRSKLAAVTLGVWIALAIVKIIERT